MNVLNSIKEKDVFDCSTFLQKKENILLNKSSRDLFFKLQDLYDMTVLNNDINIDLAADLIYNSKNLKIIVESSKEIFELFIEFFKSIKLLGVNCVELYEMKNNVNLKNTDVALIFYNGQESELYHNFLDQVLKGKFKIINILSEKTDKIESKKTVTNLYYLSCAQLDKVMCVEILLKCIYLGLLTKFKLKKLEK